ncbi:MAG: glycosyltransferase [Actinomycetota bacterium]
MRGPRLLVATSVHHPDDARIRAKLIPTLAREWDVFYGAARPGPSDEGGFTWIPLEGGRLLRTLSLTRLILSRRWDLVALHDPELLPGGIVRACLGRPTLFDLHENLPAQMRSRDKIPSLLRPFLAMVSALALRLAERVMTITLAESGYRSLFRSSHPVIANYLPDTLPSPQPAAQPPFLAYLGDVTVHRGAYLALEAAAGAGIGLVMVGRVSPPSLQSSLQRRAGELGVDLELTGPLPHQQALARVATARAGLSPLLDIGNYRHSLPTKVPEYLAVGLPVLAADLPGTRRPLDGLEGVTFVEAGDALRWREAGKDLGDAAGRRKRVVGQIPLVRDRFSWPAEEVLSVYRTAGRL